MKPGMLCLLLLSGCSFLSFPEDPPPVSEYALTWTCRSPEGCERTEDVERIDRMKTVAGECHLSSTQDASFGLDGDFGFGTTLPGGCSWLYNLSLFGHDLERARVCEVPGGVEMELAIPNADPATYSMWLVEGRDVDLL
ncbi:MAG TPA: hypothetical protein VNM90_29765 [Haliangium sp.]|nr:hypothetical protein [Haliangium sp.]